MKISVTFISTERIGSTSMFIIELDQIVGELEYGIDKVSPNLVLFKQLNEIIDDSVIIIMIIVSTEQRGFRMFTHTEEPVQFL
jgi:hypothetical protein